MKQKLTFITGNAGKAEQLKKFLGVDIKHQKIDLDELQSLDLDEVIEHKVKQAFQKIGSPVLVDDASVSINSLGKLPGPFIKFFLKELGQQKICEMVHSMGDSKAEAQIALGYFDGQEFKLFKGIIQGKISDKPKGEKGLGWDCIFIPEGYEKTRGEMTDEEFDATSPRRMAVEKLKKFLQES